MFWRSKQPKKRPRRAANFLRVERLESRDLLSGVVNIEIAPAAGVTPGNLTLVGDTANNSVMLQADPTMQGRYIITGTGSSQTLLQINGGGVTMQTVTVNGINGVITVDMGGGNDTFDFEGPTGGGNSNAPANVSITNHAGSDINIFNNVLINGNLNITKASGAVGYSELDMTNTTVIGDAIVDNVGAVGGGGASGGGDSLTQITGSTLQGGATNTALRLTNDQGNAIVQIQGTTQFGAGVAAGAAPVVSINNGTGGSRTSFAGTATVYGGLNITNGDSLPGQLELVTFNQTQVLGSTSINNGTGVNSFSDTKVIVTNSNLGTQLANFPLAATAAPVTIQNNAGFDSLTISGSQAPWGLSANNDVANGGTSNWGSSTSITGSSFGTRIGGPALPIAGDALQISGDNGADIVSVATSTLGGALDLGALNNGNNAVTLDSNTMGALRVVTGTGNDSLKLMGGNIQSAIFVNLGAGNDTMELRNGSTPINTSTVPVLPSPLLGAISIDGGLGIDTFKSDTGLVLPPALNNFEVFVSP
jgi:hypothetical protein